jgi:hypothetical protein
LLAAALSHHAGALPWLPAIKTLKTQYCSNSFSTE